MNYLVGDAVKIKTEVAPATGTTCTVTIKNPSGTAVITDQAMTDQGSGLHDYSWQSVSATHPVGRYTYLVKATNGSYSNTAKGYFYLEAQ